jgi:hypothetical protein
MKQIYYRLISVSSLIVSILFMIISCQEKFDPKSYAPIQSFGGYGASSDIAPTNLVGHWSFENSLIDSVSSAMGNGVGTSFTDGIKGQALQGADNGYFITTPSTAVLNLQSLTISLWVDVPPNLTGTYGFVCLSNTNDFWGNFDVFFENLPSTNNVKDISNAILKGHFENWTSPTTDHETWLGNFSIGPVWNKWTHIVFTYDAATSTFNVYVNGSSIVSPIVNAGNGNLTFQNASALIFGTMQFNVTPSLGTAGGPQSWASYVPGAIDEVRIYNKALVASDVGALYQLEKRGK